jgi:hypothetical protein
MTKNSIKDLTQKIMPKGFEYQSDDAFAQDFWITQIEDALDKTPRGEFVFKGEGLRQFIAHQRAVATIIENKTRKINELTAFLDRICGLNLFQFAIFRYYRKRKERRMKNL